MIGRIRFWMLLIGIAAIALALRLTGLNWDQGLYLHPDERFVVWVTTDLRWPESIGHYFNTATSPLNPYNTQHNSFVYGTFPSFLVKAIAGIFGMDAYGELHKVGRATNAVFDTGTVVLTALLARRFFNARAGFVAGVLLAFTPLFLQSAHYFTVDTIAVFFTIAAFACVVRSWDRDSIAWMALAGVMIGFAGASKPNYLIALAFIALPALELIRTRGWSALIPRMEQREYPAIPAVLTGGVISFWTFRIAQPYAFAGPNWWNISLNQVWLDDLRFWRAAQTGLVDIKPSIQWIDRTPVVYILQNMVLWGMGVALGILALVALLMAVWRLICSKHWPSWWWLGIAGWCVASIAMYGTGIAQNQRYLMHIYPFLIILVAGFLIELEQRLTRKWIAQLLTSAVLIYTVVFGLAFNSLFVRPITRIEASEWIYENVPAGSVLSNEYWDDALPFPLPGQNSGSYQGMTLDLYADESANSEKVLTLVAQTSQVDYIVISSNRVIDSVVRQPERYPVANRFYEMLLSGELGFEPVAHFHQGPEIFGIEWDDRSAEESLTVYEHPEVRIFQKTDAYDAQFLHDELNAAWGYGGYHYIPGDPLPDQMLLGDQQLEAQREYALENPRAGGGWIQDHPLIAWWIAIQVVALAAWPLTWRAFRKLPDLGWMLAKGVGLFAVSAIVLALVSWLNFAFDRSTIIVSILLLAVISVAATIREWEKFRYRISRHWRHILAGELLFTGIFLAMALVRSWERILPDHHQLQITSLMASANLPPVDLGLSGGVLHTYWAAILPWAALGKLLNLSPVVVSNLAIVGVMAMLAGIAWSLIASISRSWVAVLISLVLVFGSGIGFVAGLAPVAMGSSLDLGMLTLGLMVVVLVYLLKSQPKHPWICMGLIALLAGALSVSAGWGVLVAIALVGIGLAIQEWMQRSESDPWWPTVRRFALMLMAIAGSGIAIWYPAFAAHTATQRNLTNPSLWGLATLRSEIGLLLILLVVLVTGIGTIGVLASLWDEGAPGIVVSTIAVAVVASLAIFAWRIDSALMFVMLISLLAVTAAWNWLEDEARLWSVAMVILACLLLTMAQTQSMHFIPGGESESSQLVTIAWVLLVIAVGFGFAGAIRRLPSRDMGIALVGAVIATIGMITPTWSHISSLDHERTSLANPVILATNSQIETADWFIENADGWPVILTSDGTISALTGLPTVIGDQNFELNTRPGWNQMVDQRNMDRTTIYAEIDSWSTVEPLIQEYGIEYIVLSNQERVRFDDIDEAFAASVDNGNLEVVFEYEDVVVYKVRTTETETGD